MIINQSGSNDTTLWSPDAKITECGIKTTSKAFQILSSTLYSNKIRAVIRELCCNAYDSHVAAGKEDVPFEVKLPNSLDATFHVKDFGVGMSSHQVESVFAMYFESTKTESNDYIGAMGLGAKSPFSYTKSFTVTTVKDRTLSIFTAFIGNNGKPQVAEMLNTPTTEPNGVTVEITVNQADFATFRTEAEEVLSPFRVQPRVIGVSNFTRSVIEYRKDIIPGVRERVHSRNGDRLVAIMGNIRYPFKIPGSNAEMHEEFSDLMDEHLDIEFANGTLEFLPSREGLSFDEFTIKSITNRLREIKQSLLESMTTELNSITSKWDRAASLIDNYSRRLWNTAKEEYIGQYPLAPLVTYGPSWHGSSYKYWSHELEITAKKAAELGFKITPFTFSSYRDRISTGRSTANHTATQISVSNRTYFFLNTAKAIGVRRAKLFLKGTTTTYTDSDRHLVVLEHIDPAKPGSLQAFLDYLGNPSKVITLDECPQVESAPKTARTARGTGVVYVARSECNNGSRWAFKALGKVDEYTPTSLPGPRYYVNLESMQYAPNPSLTLAPGLGHTNAKLPTMMNLLRDLGIENVYGVSKTIKGEVADDPLWVAIDDPEVLGKLITKRISNDRDYVVVFMANNNPWVFNNSLSNSFQVCDHSNHPVIRGYWDEVKKYHGAWWKDNSSYSKKRGQLNNLWLQAVTMQLPIVKSILDEHAKVYEAYKLANEYFPMLKFVDLNDNSTSVIRKYIGETIEYRQR